MISSQNCIHLINNNFSINATLSIITCKKLEDSLRNDFINFSWVEMVKMFGLIRWLNFNSLFELLLCLVLVVSLRLDTISIIVFSSTWVNLKNVSVWVLIMSKMLCGENSVWKWFPKIYEVVIILISDYQSPHNYLL